MNGHFAEVRVTVTDDDIVVRADVRNVSGRSGKYVAQVYASWPASVVDRPVRQLVGFTALRVAAGGTRTVETIVPRRALAYWDHGWRQEGGVVELTLAENAGDPGMTVRVELDPSRAIDRVDSAR